MVEQLVNAISGSEGGVCPLCRQEVHGNIMELAQTNLSAAVAAADTAASAAAAESERLNSMKEAVKQYEFQRASIDRKLASVTAQIEQVKGTITVRTTEEEVRNLQKKVDELQVTVKFKQDLEIRKVGFENHIKTLEDSVQHRSARVEELLNKAQLLMRGIGVSDAGKIDERRTALEADAAKCREVSQEVARLTGRITEMEKSLSNLNKTVEELQDREQKQAALKEVLDTLAAVRSWFHYQNGPQAVINSLLERITSGVNDFLDKFGAGFYAIPDFGTTSFKYWYTDGRVPPEDGYPPVSEMSGGEAVVLAVSFRFATYCLFASRIGLLTLDEPTVYLDDNNISRFCNLLQRVKELATDMNLQIFISTHEQAVMPFMDSTIKFGTYNIPEEEDERKEEDAA
jgi:DNA repair exonuclease SbcCD ATPase subunit